MPIAAFAATIAAICPMSVAPLPSASEESMTGSISSEVAKNTASIVPTLIEPVENSVAAAPDMPHCGIAPRSPPSAGPALREYECSMPSSRRLLFSSISISRYARKRMGMLSAPSFNASSAQSSISSVNSKVSCFQKISYSIVPAAVTFVKTRRLFCRLLLN